MSADITRINEELIYRFNILLFTQSCRFVVNAADFEKFTLKNILIIYYPLTLVLYASICSQNCYAWRCNNFYSLATTGMMSANGQESQN